MLYTLSGWPYKGSLYKEGEVPWDTDWYEFLDKSEWLDCLVGAQKEQNWKVHGEEIWGRGMRMYLWLWAQSMCIFVSYINAHQRTPTAEGTLNHKVDKMSHLVDVDS